MEYCDNQNLYHFLHKSSKVMNLTERLKLAIGIARGMHYMHSFSPLILHRDLKSLNILLDIHMTPKICDFG